MNFLNYKILNHIDSNNSNTLYEIIDDKYKKYTLKIFYPLLDNSSEKNFMDEVEFIDKVNSNDKYMFNYEMSFSVQPNDKNYSLFYDLCNKDSTYILEKTPIYCIIYNYVATIKCTDPSITIDYIPKLIEDILSYIQILHKHNIIGLNIQPSNILYDINQNKFIFIDYIQSINEFDPRFIHPIVIQLDKKSSDDYKVSDIYALGVVCYLIVNHQYPYKNYGNNNMYPTGYIQSFSGYIYIDRFIDLMINDNIIDSAYLLTKWIRIPDFIKLIKYKDK